VLRGPDGVPAACRWTGGRSLRGAAGFEALVPGAPAGSIGDLGVHDPSDGSFRLPARWRDARARLEDVIDLGHDLDVLAGEIVVDRGMRVVTRHG
jgi:hypothetical protein